MLFKSARISLLFLFVSLLGAVKGSQFVEANKRGCLEYGHSCWGGHGKRSLQTPKSLNQIPSDGRVTILQLILDKNFRYNLKIGPTESPRDKIFEDRFIQAPEYESTKKSVPTKRPYSNIYGKIASDKDTDEDLTYLNEGEVPDVRLFKILHNSY